MLGEYQTRTTAAREETKPIVCGARSSIFQVFDNQLFWFRGGRSNSPPNLGGAGWSNSPHDSGRGWSNPPRDAERIRRGLGGPTPLLFQEGVRSEERRVGKECRSRWS